MINSSYVRQAIDDRRISRLMAKNTSDLTAQVGRMNLVMGEVRDDLKSLQEEMTYTLQKFNLPLAEHTKCVTSIGKMRKKLSEAMTEGDAKRNKKAS